MICAAVIASVVTMAALATPVFAQWPTTCVDLNDIVEAHLGNRNNVGIYQRVFGVQAEAACQNDHRDDVRGVFAWAFADASQPTETATPDLAWPTDCVELNDIVEAHLGNEQNVEIYQRVFGARAEAYCRNDHRADVQGVFGWAFGRPAPPPPSRVAFESNIDGDYEIFVVNSDGTGLTQLTHNGAWDGVPLGRRMGVASRSRRIAAGIGRSSRSTRTAAA